MELAPIIQPGTVRGFVSAQHPSVLPAGFQQELVNVRLQAGVIEARDGDSEVLPVGEETTTPRGMYSGYFDGMLTAFAAFGDGDHVRVYKSNSPRFATAAGTYSVDAGTRKITTTGSFENVVDGMWIQVSGFANSGNNGQFRVLSHTGTELTIDAADWPSPANESGASAEIAGWIEITSDDEGGPYGDTRLADADDRPVWFSIVKDRPREGLTAYDLLVIQNGLDTPRIYARGAIPVSNGSGFGSGTYGMSLAAAPSRPEGGAYLTYSPTLSTHFDMSDEANTTCVNDSPVEISINDTGSSPFNYLELIVESAYAPGDGAVCRVEFASALDIAGARQMILLANNDDSLGFWDDLTIYLRDGDGETITIYSSFTGIGSVNAIERPVPSAGAGIVSAQIAYPLPPFRPPYSSGFDPTDVTQVIFAWAGPAPASDITSQIFTIGFGGQFQGGVDFAVTYAGADSRQESAHRIIEKMVPGSASEMGGPAADSMAPTLTDDGSFFVDYIVNVQEPPEDGRANGVSLARAYVREFGQADYYFAGEAPTLQWDSGAPDWEYVSNGATTEPGSVTVTLGDPNLSRPTPGPAALSLPTGRAMCAANGRFFASNGADRLYFSDYEFPFRFRKAVQFFGIEPVLTSGGSFAIDGQSIQQLTSMGTFAGGSESPGAPLTGSGTVFIHTESNLYALSGTDSRSLSSPKPILAYGTLSPFSVARFRSGFYWLSQEGQVLFYGQNGFRNLSIDLVDNLTKSVTASQRVWVSGATRMDRYHLCLPGEEECILVWNERLASWESCDTLDGTTPRFLSPFFAQDRQQLIACSSNGIFEYAQPGHGATDFRLATREVSAGWNQKIVVNGCAILCDSTESSSTITVKRYTPGEAASAASPNGSISIQGDTPRIWKMDQTGVGAEGGSFYLSIEFSSAPAGWRIYNVAAETELVDSGGPKRD